MDIEETMRWFVVGKWFESTTASVCHLATDL